MVRPAVERREDVRHLHQVRRCSTSFERRDIGTEIERIGGNEVASPANMPGHQSEIVCAAGSVLPRHAERRSSFPAASARCRRRSDLARG